MLNKAMFDKNSRHQSKLPAKPVMVPNGGLSRLVAAAVVDPKFCELLLTDVRAALSHGYNNQPLSLTTDELNLVLAVENPDSLADFAWQIIKIYNQT